MPLKVAILSRAGGFVALADRCDAARLILPYMYSKLHALEVSQGNDENGETSEDRAAMAQQLAQDPDIRHLFERVAVKAAEIAREGGNDSSDSLALEVDSW